MLRNWISIRHYARRTGMPGLNKTAKEFKNIDEVMHDPEGFGNIESDFMDVHKSHKQHEHEIQKHREKVRHLIVGNKYFKIKNPNFLTYAEKEQIRLLHARDTQEWDAERLAESFPATPQIIGEIMKAKWVATDAKRIDRHDRAVLKNWEMFNRGKLTELDPALEVHLRKFANRTPEDLKNLKATVRPKPELPKPSRTEFLSIVTDGLKFRKATQARIEGSTKQISTSTNAGNPFKMYKQKENSSKFNENKPPVQQSAAASNQLTMEDETYLIDKIENKKPMRFQDLMRSNRQIQEESNHVAMHQLENPQGTGLLEFSKDATDDSHVEKFKADEVEIKGGDMISVSNAIREQIHIPKHLWRKGSTYKLNDCYYDDDGELLYIVPGMTGQLGKE